MERMKKYLFRMFVVVLAVASTACDNENENTDLEPPAIELIHPESRETIPAGENIVVEATFTDNQALATYSIDIHNAFDDHGHGRILEDPDLQEFIYKNNFELPATTMNTIILEEEIRIVENSIAGPYHFIVQAIDEQGNATSYQDDSTVEIEILITNGSMADITLTNLVDNHISITVGQPFSVEGKITDPDHATLHGLEEVRIMLTDPDEEHSHARVAQEELFLIEIPQSTLESYLLPEGGWDIAPMIDYSLSQTEADNLRTNEVDHLDLIIEVHDLQGNITIRYYPVDF